MTPIPIILISPVSVADEPVRGRNACVHFALNFVSQTELYCNRGVKRNDAPIDRPRIMIGQ